MKFDKIEESKANKVFVLVEFYGGDADTDHPEEFGLDQPFDLDMELNEKSIQLIKELFTLKEILDCNSRSYVDNRNGKAYEIIKEKYGEEIADHWQYSPNDPTCDFQFKCAISRINIIGYDSNGNKYRSYIDEKKL